MADQNNYDGPERRKFTRISFSFPVRFKQYDYDETGVEKEGLTQYAYSNDISIEGIKLKFLESVDVGKYLKLKLTLLLKGLGEADNSRLYSEGTCGSSALTTQSSLPANRAK